MMKTFLFTFLMLCAFHASSQNGYLGKKNFLSFEATGNIPLLSGSFSREAYHNWGGSMKSGKEWLNYGYGISFLHSFSRKHSFGVELFDKQFGLPSPNYLVTYFAVTADLNDSDTTWLRMRPINMHTRSAMLVLQLHSKNGIGPVGFTHRFGLGLSITSMGYKTLKYSLNEFSPEETSPGWTTTDRYHFENQNLTYKSVTVQYGISVRHPLTDNLAVDLGAKSLFNLYFKPSEFEKADASFIDSEDLYFRSQRENLFSFSLCAGLTYLF